MKSITMEVIIKASKWFELGRMSKAPEYARIPKASPHPKRHRLSRSVWSAVRSTAFFRPAALPLALACLSTLAAVTNLPAAEEIDVTGHVDIGQVKPIPVSMSGFSGEVAEVLRLDLYVMGFSF